MILTIKDRKYFKPHSDSGTIANWQTDVVAEDITRLLHRHEITPELISDETGSYLSWSASGLDYWINIECFDTDPPSFRLDIGVGKRRMLLFGRELPDSVFANESWVAELKKLNSSEEDLTSNEKPLPSKKSEPKEILIFSHQGWWVAALNLSLSIGGIYFTAQFVHDATNKTIGIVFLSLFGLFWVKFFLFGWRLKMSTDGRFLKWQDGGQIDSVEMKRIKAVIVHWPGIVSVDGRLFVKRGNRGYCPPPEIALQLTNGEKKSFSPNLADVLRGRDWSKLREMIANIRTVSPVVLRADPKLKIYE